MTQKSPLKIGVIDSGLDYKWTDALNCIGGVGMDWDEDSDSIIELNDSYQDENGHGTIVTNIIRNYAPESEFYIIRVLDHELNGYSEALVHALRKCRTAGVTLVNLSLGTTEEEFYPAILKEVALCLYQGMIIVCASSAFESYPSVLPGVITVADEGFHKSWDLNELTRTKIDFTVKGRFKVDFPDGNRLLLRNSTSFAAPVITGLLAKAAAEDGKSSFDAWSAIQLLKKSYPNREYHVL